MPAPQAKTDELYWAETRTRGLSWRPWAPLMLIAAGLAVYLNSFDVPFLLDDHRLIEAMGRLEAGEGDLLSFLLSERRALLLATLWLNHVLGGEAVAGYHLVNTAIHLLAGMALYGVVRRTLWMPAVGERFREAATPIAFAIALLWIVHPLNTQAVTYIVQRGESMMGLFFLLTLYCAIRHGEVASAAHPPADRASSTRAQTAGSATGWACAAVIACLLGMMSKEVMVAAPLIVVLHDWTFSQSSPGRLLRRRGLLYAALLATILVLPVLDTQVTERDQSAGFGFAALTWWQYALTQPLVMLRYLVLGIVPWPLVFDHWQLAQHTRFEREDVAWSVSFLQEAAPVADIVAAALVTALGVWRRRWWAFCAGWFFIILGPTSSIMPIADLMVEHRMYLPLIGVIALLVIAVSALLLRIDPARRAPMQRLVVIAPALVLAALTIQRNSDYRDEVTLWSTVVDRRPHNPRAWHNLGSAYHRQAARSLGAEREALLDQAMHAWQTSIERAPNWPDSYINTARVLIDHGRFAAAEQLLDEAADRVPRSPDVWYALGEARFHQGDLRGAADAFALTVELAPRHAQAHGALGAVSLRLDELGPAREHLLVSLSLQPTDIVAAQNAMLLADALAHADQFDAAAEVMAAAVEAIRRQGSLSAGDMRILEGALQAYRERRIP